MTWGTIIICILVAVLFFFAVRRILKKGTCGGECSSGCEGCMHSTRDNEKGNNTNLKYKIK